MTAAAIFAASPELIAVESPTALKVIRVGIETGSKPFSDVDERGHPLGFCVDLVNGIARERHFQPQFIAEPWPTILADFREGRIDLVANMAYLPDRLEFADYAVPHAQMSGAAFIRTDDHKIKTLADLAGVRLAVLRDSVSHMYARRHGLEANLVFTNSLQEALALLDRGEVDAVLCTRLIGLKLARDQKLRHIRPADFEVPELSYELHMAVHKGDAALLYEINYGLHQLHVDGTFDTLYERWLGPMEARRIRWRDVRPYMLPTAVFLIALGFAFWRQRHLLNRLVRQAEALKTSEERLTLVLEGSLDAFWDWDIPSGQVTRSERWAEITGYALDEIPANIDGLLPLTHPDDLARVKHTKATILSEGHVRVEYRIRARDGGWRWIHDRGKVVARDASGAPLRVTGAASDATARKETERALARSQALLEQTQHAAAIGGWEVDLRSRVFYWTSQMYRIHDLDSAGKIHDFAQALDYFTPTSQPIIRDAIEKTIADGTAFDLELEIVTAKSRLIWVRVIGQAEMSGGRATRVFGSVQDISQRKKSDEDRQKLQLKMLEAQKLESLGVLAGGIAHDFNNLLTIILGNASLGREPGVNTQEVLNQIETAGLRAADLCRQMLAYAGKTRFAVETLDLNAIVEDTLHLLRLSISKNATLEFSLAPEALPIDADASQIRQVVMNLVINASDAVGTQPGRIRVSTREERVTREQLKEARLGQDAAEGIFVVLEVDDTGSGMSASTLARIFDPFFTTKFAGRGLGLAAVLGIVRAHRGAFFVSSELGRGSVFRMLLPKATSLPAEPKGSVTRPSSMPSTTGTIMVVDDEANVRKVAAAILERQGYTVTLASDGYEALALALAHGAKFSAVLLDLTMPGLDGPAVLQELRKLSTRLPVLLMSGFSEADVQKHFAGDPLVAFLPKPFTSEDLLKKIAALIQRQQASAVSPDDDGAA